MTSARGSYRRRQTWWALEVAASVTSGFGAIGAGVVAGTAPAWPAAIRPGVIAVVLAIACALLVRTRGRRWRRQVP